MNVTHTEQLERVQQTRQATKIVQQVAELAAQRIVHRFREAHQQWQDDYLPLDELVAWLGLAVELFHPDSRPAGTYGYIDSDESEHLIWLRRNLPDSIRRFTLAHELGHIVLHCEQTPQLMMLLQDMASLLEMARTAQTPPLSSEDPCQDRDVEEDSLENEERLQDRLGIGQQYDPRSLREQAANVFAAELLMPLERVRSLYLDARINPWLLSDTFGVSPSALLNRLANLLKPAETLENTAVPSSAVGSTGRKSFDEFQQAAIEAPTPALIIAGPGSGKTSTLIGRVEYLVQTLAVPPQRILALTFSRKAAQEMEERLLHLFTDGRDAGNRYDGLLPKICTFHAFCADLLRQYAEQVGLRPDFGLLDEAESYTLLRQQSHALNLRHYQRLQSPTAYFPDLLKAISRAKDELVTSEEYAQLAQRMKERAGDDAEKQEQAERAAEVAHVYALYQQALAQRGDTDFGGLLMLTLQLFADHPAVLREQQQYQHILVDEFQDVNRASGVLLRELAGVEQRVWVVGDTNQAIYRFRGASPANMSRFTHDFPGAVILPLSRNYRSCPDLVKVAESFRCKQLEFGEEPGKNEATRLTRDETSVTIAHATDEASEILGIAHDIQARHASGYAYRDMAILCRTRAQVQKVSRVLVDMGLPVAERSNLLEQDAIKDVLAVLLLLTDASGSGLLRLSEEYALSQEDLETLLITANTKRHVPAMMLIRDGEAPLNMSIEGRHAVLRLSTLLERLADLRVVRGVWSLLAYYLFIETTLIRNLLYDKHYGPGEIAEAAQAQLDDYDALLQLARHYDAQYEHDSQQTTSPSLVERVKGFLEYLRLLLLLKQEGAVRRSEQNEDDEQIAIDTLRVMTVHASKGLEFPVVYMPGLTAQRFPAMRRANPVPPPVGMTHDLQIDEQEAGETERQAHESGESSLFYVGVTRARDALVLSYSDRYGRKSYNPSPYLDVLRAGLTEGRITRLEWKFPSEVVLPDEEDAPNVSSAGKGMTERLSQEFLRAMLPQGLRATDIEAYHRCPRQYAYSRLYHFSSEASGYQLFHRATQQAIGELKRQHQGTASEEVDVQELYAQHWQKVGGDGLPFAALYEQHGQQVLAVAQRALQTKTHEETWHTQYDVEIAGHNVQVTVDRVEAQSSQIIEGSESGAEQQSAQTIGGMPIKHPAPSTSVTFKRTRFGKRKEKPEPEMRDLFYTLAYRKQYPGETVNLQHHNLSTGEATPLSMTPKKEQRLQTEVEQAIRGMEQHEYPAKPKEASECLACPFSFICPV